MNMSNKIVKDAFIKIKISDDRYIMAMKSTAVLELLASMVNGAVEMLQKEELRKGIIEEGFHPDYLDGFHASAKIMYDTFVKLIDTAEVNYAIGDITPGSISRIDPTSL